LKNTISGLLRLDYRNMEAIFVNDGSKDATIATLTERLDLQFLYNGGSSVGFYQSQKHPWIYVIDKENTGKAASLNTGIAFCHNEFVITLDGDCVLEKDALHIINHTFQDQDVVASAVDHLLQPVGHHEVVALGHRLQHVLVHIVVEAEHLLVERLPRVVLLEDALGRLGSAFQPIVEERATAHA
jgi:cellulose synthase/poly-beta-1,6-N-acetylglucosamine synthase-like glycosyltransferase